MEDEALKLSMIESKRRKRISEYMDQLMKERNLKIEEVDSTQWHQLIRDAEKLANNDERI